MSGAQGTGPGRACRVRSRASPAHSSEFGQVRRRTKETKIATEFQVVDLTQEAPGAQTESLLQGRAVGSVDLGQLRSQLDDIRDALSPVLAEQAESAGGFHLNTMELDLTVGLEGQIWFVAKGKGEASLKLTWSRAS